MMRSTLLEELTARRLRNKSYSMRAFSRDLGIPPSTLSGILSGKHQPSESTMLKVESSVPSYKKDIPWVQGKAWTIGGDRRQQSTIQSLIESLLDILSDITMRPKTEVSRPNLEVKISQNLAKPGSHNLELDS